MTKWRETARELGGWVCLVAIPQREQVVERLPVACEHKESAGEQLGWLVLDEEVVVRRNPVFVRLDKPFEPGNSRHGLGEILDRTDGLDHQDEFRVLSGRDLLQCQSSRIECLVERRKLRCDTLALALNCGAINCQPPAVTSITVGSFLAKISPLLRCRRAVCRRRPASRCRHG